MIFSILLLSSSILLLLCVLLHYIHDSSLWTCLFLLPGSFIFNILCPVTNIHYPSSACLNHLSLSPLTLYLLGKVQEMRVGHTARKAARLFSASSFWRISSWSLQDSETQSMVSDREPLMSSWINDWFEHTVEAAVHTPGSSAERR